jgi:hypothetical protein
LLVSLTALCLSALAEAAAPHVEEMHCGSLLCDAGGCETTTTKQVLAPAAALVPSRLLPVDAPPATPIAVVSATAPPGRRLVPPGSRAPPLA